MMDDDYITHKFEEVLSEGESYGLVYRPPNYPGRISMNATIKVENEEDKSC